ncbi:MAG: thiamine phosphate synthase [Bacteroidetes bacterium]|nr:thiamine phosphate synthase [Bacteroidota bacterium]
MDISKLQYISDGINDDIKEVLDAGCRWIQLRIKEEKMQFIEKIALKVQTWCKSYDAAFIINDYAELAGKINADGVHLGKYDMPPANARHILGNKIIGGTANTLNDILEIKNFVDYIGLGPYKFTKTKKKLSPTLGLEGYKNILDNLNFNVPIIAIGGIDCEDVSQLIDAGVNGIAISSSIYNSSNREQKVKDFLSYLSPN